MSATLRERTVVLYAQFASGIFIFLGMIGLFKEHFAGFASSEGFELFRLRVNPLMCVIHLTVGLVGVAMALTVSGARRFVLWTGVVGVPFAVLEFVLGDSDADIFGRDGDVALVQLAIAVIALGVAWWTRPSTVPAPAG